MPVLLPVLWPVFFCFLAFHIRKHNIIEHKLCGMWLVHSIFEYNHYCRVPVEAGAGPVACSMASFFVFWLFALENTI